ncbi:ParB/RepB/Spo0J family partition protein [Catenulispora yoronensis]
MADPKTTDQKGVSAMTVTITQPEADAADAAPADSATAAPEQQPEGIAETPQPQEAVMIPLAALIVHPGNVRKNLNLNREFIASIKAEGIIEPLEITASATPGLYNLIDGHRRMAGAFKAKHSAVPCVFKAARADDVAGQFLDMVMTSRHKEKLTTQEEANALFAAYEAGADINRLAKAYGKKETVNAALKAATLPAETQEAAAKTAAEAEYAWTVEQLAALSEFADDAEATARLLEAFNEDQFAWQAERERADRAESSARQEIRELHKTAGVMLYEYDDAPAGLVKLATMPTTGGKGIEPEAHAACPGHVAVFERYGTPRVFYACADSETCEHIDREHFTVPAVPVLPTNAEAVLMDAAKKAEESARRKRVIKGNTDWRAARTVRHKWLADLMARTSLSREDTDAITRWTAENYLRMSWVVSSGISGYVGQADLKAELLGVKNPNWSELTAKASAKRLLLFTFLPLVTAYEKNMHDQQWRTDGRYDYRSEREQAAAWLTFLMSLGYKISPIERAVLEGRDYAPGTPAPAESSLENEDGQDEADDADPQDETAPDENGPGLNRDGSDQD